MNKNQWEIFTEFMGQVSALLAEIADNTRLEKIEEAENTITGFSTEDNK